MEGLFSELLIGLIKINGTKHIAVIGHAKRRHIVFSCFFDKFFNAAGSVEETVLRVDMKMDKIGIVHIQRCSLLDIYC